VPSSTFSSEPRRIPGGDWRAIWIAALVIATGLTAWFELTARVHRQRPAVVDDPAWWAIHRRHASGDPQVAVFLGTSRMELAYSRRAFAEAVPTMQGVQLAIDGVSAFGPLEDLADDPAFRGLAIVDVAEIDLQGDESFRAAEPWVERGRALWRAPGAIANRVLASVVQARFAVLAVGGRQLIASLAGARRWPDPTWVVGDRDRTFQGDYSLADPAALEKRRKKAFLGLPQVPPDPATWLAPVSRIADAVRRIRSHGGDVVFVHLPITGALADAFDRTYPRARYWDAFVARTGAQAIHFRDVPAMAAFECPDGMHLDQRDQDAMTRALADELRRRGLLR
jgi:hypothetical protein